MIQSITTGKLSHNRIPPLTNCRHILDHHPCATLPLPVHYQPFPIFTLPGSSSLLFTPRPFVESTSRLSQPSPKSARKCPARKASRKVSRRILMLSWIAKAFAWLSFPTDNPDNVDADMLNKYPHFQFHTPLLLYPFQIARSLLYNSSNTTEPSAERFF